MPSIRDDIEVTCPVFVTTFRQKFIFIMFSSSFVIKAADENHQHKYTYKYSQRGPTGPNSRDQTPFKTVSMS
jgi:hypothetical protein